MKLLILTLSILFSVKSVLSAQEDSQLKKTEVVKVKITEETTELPQTITEKVTSPKVEIELVEKVEITTSDSSVVDAPEPVTVNTVDKEQFTPTKPDNNLMIYFILLMVIVIGIMALASVIPGPSSTRTDK